MRKRPLLLAASFFLAGISYAAVKDVRIVVLLPFCVLYLIVPKLKAFGWKKGMSRSLISVGMMLILFIAGNMHMEHQEDFREQYLSGLTEGQNITILGKISKIETSSFGYQVYVSDCYLFQNSKYVPCNQVLVYASDLQFQVGEIQRITGQLHKFSAARNEGNFDSALYYKSLNIDFYIQMKQADDVADHTNKITQMALQLKAKLGNVYDVCLNEVHSGIVKGMVLGDKSTLEEEIKNLYTKAGISHMLAISGLHVSVIGRGLYNCLRKTGFGFCLSGIIAGIVLVFYGIMTGNSVSARRAIGMLFISMAGQVVGRSYDMLNGLGAMCLFLLWENPFLIGYSGFWFFVTALFGVGFVGEVFVPNKVLNQKSEQDSVLEKQVIRNAVSEEKRIVCEKQILPKIEFERRTNNPPLQMREALNGGFGGFLCQVGIEKPYLTSCEAACVHEEVAKADSECPLYQNKESIVNKTMKSEHRKKEEVPWRLRIMYRIEESLWMSIAVTITTLPIVAYCYFEVPILSSFLNCMLIPLLTPLFFCALFGGIAGLFSMSLAKIVLYPCGWILQIYELVCQWNANVPFLTVITGKPSIEKMIVYYLLLMCGIVFLQYFQEFLKQKEK